MNDSGYRALAVEFIDRESPRGLDLDRLRRIQELQVTAHDRDRFALDRLARLHVFQLKLH